MTQVFGIPVNGYPQHSSASYREQYQLEDLREAFLDLIEDPNVIEFGWRQYTPYFNDGDICEFSVYEPWIRTVNDEDVDVYDLDIGSSHPTLGNHDWKQFTRTPEEIEAERKRQLERGWVNPYVSTYEYREVPREPKFPETYERAKKILEIASGHYDRDLLEAFGDHAQVTVTKDGIKIDEYDHD